MRFFHGERRAASISLAHGATGWSVIALDALLRESAALGALGHFGGSLTQLAAHLLGQNPPPR